MESLKIGGIITIAKLKFYALFHSLSHFFGILWVRLDIAFFAENTVTKYFLNVWIMLWDPFLMKKLLKVKFVGIMNSARDPFVLLKYALYTEEKSTTAAKKKKRKENAKHESKPHLCVIVSFGLHFVRWWKNERIKNRVRASPAVSSNFCLFGEWTLHFTFCLLTFSPTLTFARPLAKLKFTFLKTPRLQHHQQRTTRLFKTYNISWTSILRQRTIT